MTREVAFEELYQTHYRRVHGLCRRLLGSAERADDAAQEVFLRAYRSLGAYDRSQPFAGWIMRIASNYCVDVVRRRSKEAALFGSEAEETTAAQSDEGDALGELLALERARAVKAAVDTLPEKYRLPVVLAYYTEASYDEISAELGITRTHVGALLCRARQTLRSALAKETQS
jgi:RNA polymerase sigma-70 factor (ECF subfamily)